MSIAEYFLDALIRSYAHFYIEYQDDIRFKIGGAGETQEFTERMRKLLAIKSAFTPKFNGIALL